MLAVNLKSNVINFLIDSIIVRFSSLYLNVIAIIPKQWLLALSFVSIKKNLIKFSLEQTIASFSNALFIILYIVTNLLQFYHNFVTKLIHNHYMNFIRRVSDAG